MGMSAFNRTTIAFAALLAFAAPAQAADDYVTNAADIVKAADWTKMETVTIEIDEFSYTPSEVTFKVNQPYKLVLKNNGEKKHYFTSEAFNKAVATRKAQTKAAEIKAPYFKAFELVANGGELEFYFVPVKPGKYPVICTIEDHEKQGMHGTLTIE